MASALADSSIVCTIMIFPSSTETAQTKKVNVLLLYFSFAGNCLYVCLNVHRVDHMQI